MKKCLAVLFTLLLLASIANGQDKTFHTGVKVPADVKARHAKSWLKHSLRLMALPRVTADSLDYRKFGIITAIRDQGDCGSCHLFAGAFGCEASLIKSNQAVNDGKWKLAEQHVMDCADTGDCEGGWPEDTVNFCIKHGLYDELSYGAYKGRAVQCRTVNGKLHKVTDCGYVGQSEGVPSTQAMIDALARYGPLIVCVAADNKFMNHTGETVYKDSGSRQINHAVAIVGYYKVGTKVVWIVRNSWGAAWCNSGYIAMEEKANAIGYGAMWVASTVLPPPPDPTPPVPPIGGLQLLLRDKAGKETLLHTFPDTAPTPKGKTVPDNTPQELLDFINKYYAPKAGGFVPKKTSTESYEDFTARIAALPACERVAAIQRRINELQVIVYSKP